MPKLSKLAILPKSAENAKVIKRCLNCQNTFFFILETASNISLLYKSFFFQKTSIIFDFGTMSFFKKINYAMDKVIS